MTFPSCAGLFLGKEAVLCSHVWELLLSSMQTLGADWRVSAINTRVVILFYTRANIKSKRRKT